MAHAVRQMGTEETPTQRRGTEGRGGPGEERVEGKAAGRTELDARHAEIYSHDAQVAMYLGQILFEIATALKCKKCKLTSITVTSPMV